MTTIARNKVKCSVCGTVNECSAVMSTNAFGSPDLDTRPPEMQRSTMSMWVHTCRKCGYAASDLSDTCDVTADFLKSDEYVSCEGIGFKSHLAKDFYRQYMIAVKGDKIRIAFFALLHAAWACDDAKDTDNAKLCREKAIPLASVLAASKSPQSENFILMRADMMRRAGQFEEVINEYSSVKFEGDRRNNPEVMNAVLRFEIEKARAKDSKCYRISDAL